MAPGSQQPPPTALLGRGIGCPTVTTIAAGKVGAAGLLLGVSFSQLRAGVWGSEFGVRTCSLLWAFLLLVFHCCVFGSC